MIAHKYPELIKLIDAAVEVSAFVKQHDYPEPPGEDFQEFTRLLNNLEIELKKAGILQWKKKQ